MVVSLLFMLIIVVLHVWSVLWLGFPRWWISLVIYGGYYDR